MRAWTAAASVGREAVAREAGVQVLGHLARAERSERELAGRAFRPQVERRAAQVRVLGVHVGLPERPDQQRALPRQPAADVVQQVDARRVGPLHVLDQEHDRERAAGRLHEVAGLADQPLLRRARGLAAQGAVGVGQDTCRHLHADRRRVRAQQNRRLLTAVAGEQPADRVEERQERLRRAVRLDAAARRDRQRPRPGPRAAQELADERALADAAVAGHEHDRPRAGHRRREALLEPRELGPATHEHLAGALRVPSRRRRALPRAAPPPSRGRTRSGRPAFFASARRTGASSATRSGEPTSGAGSS